MRTLFIYGFYPACLGGSMLLTSTLFAAGWSAGAAISVTSVIAGVVIFAAQWVQPYSRQWRHRLREYALDGMHAVLVTGGTTWLVKLLAFGAWTETGVQLTLWVGSSLWPGHWPLALQVFLALVISDLGPYLFHRLCHESWLWRVHSIHHSPEDMQVLASARNHPLHVLVAYSLQMAPLVVLGAPPEVVMLKASFHGVNGLLQHANIDLRFGPLSYVLATPEMHMWHHNREIAISNHNYANNIILWDLLFKSFYRPSDKRPTTDVGLPHGTRFPNTFVGHMITPFIWDRVKAPSTLEGGAVPAEAPMGSAKAA